ncbi:hypothetical protein ES708_17990 [subsurface metagenome]
MKATYPHFWKIKSHRIAQVGRSPVDPYQNTIEIGIASNKSLCADYTRTTPSQPEDNSTYSGKVDRTLC